MGDSGAAQSAQILNHGGFGIENLVRARFALTAVDARTRTLQALDDLEKNSIDFYTAVRSAYTQRRAAMIREKGDPGGSKAAIDNATRVALVR